MTLKTLVVILALASITTMVCESKKLSLPDILLKSEWQEFKATHGKSYETGKEDAHRFQLYLNKRYEVARHNHEFALGLKTYTKAINKFADMTHEEVEKMYMGYRGSSESHGPLKTVSSFGANSSSLPRRIDWRKLGAVTPVQDQSNCGSGWAFSAVGSLEGAHFLKTGNLVPLSAQNLVDCSKENYGCSGGWVKRAFDYVIRNNGIDTDDVYPYTGYQSQCRYDSSDSGTSEHSYVGLERGNEKVLQDAVANQGPVSICWHATESFAFYDSGVFIAHDCPRGALANHCALIVGYGTDSNAGDYWLIKNSWGTSWGEEGYARYARNRNNMCLIASGSVLPIV